MVKIMLCNAGGPGSILGWGTKYSLTHAMGHLSLQTTTRESVCHKERAAVPQLRPDAAKQIILKKNCYIHYWIKITNSLQYPCLENPMDRGALWAAVAESNTTSD